MPIKAYLPLCDALVLVLAPLIEVVIHKIDSDTIFYINGGLSARKVGDPSLLGQEPFEENIETTVYSKISPDGRLFRSISVPVEGKWLLCINCDVSVFHQMKSLSERLLQTPLADKPASLFKNDWQEQLHLAIHDFLNQKKWAFESLSQSQKKALIQHLYEAGAFNEKKAADYVAQTLSIGRATVFNYLKAWRSK